MQYLCYCYVLFAFLKIIFFQTCLRHKMAIGGDDSCRGGIGNNIKLGLHKYFRFGKAKNRNTRISLVINKNRCHK